METHFWLHFRFFISFIKLGFHLGQTSELGQLRPNGTKYTNKLRSNSDIGAINLHRFRLSPDFFIEDLTHVMIKVMLPIICLRNHNSKITVQVPCYVKFHVTLSSMLWIVIFHVKSHVTKHEFWGLLVLKSQNPM